MAKKLTPWFPANVKPARIGLYRRSSWAGRFSYWNGYYWCAGINDPADEPSKLEESKTMKSRDQYAQWHGLARRPSKG